MSEGSQPPTLTQRSASVSKFLDLAQQKKAKLLNFRERLGHSLNSHSNSNTDFQTPQGATESSHNEQTNTFQQSLKPASPNEKSSTTINTQDSWNMSPRSSNDSLADNVISPPMRPLATPSPPLKHVPPQLEPPHIELNAMPMIALNCDDQFHSTPTATTTTAEPSNTNRHSTNTLDPGDHASEHNSLNCNNGSRPSSRAMSPPSPQGHTRMGTRTRTISLKSVLSARGTSARVAPSHVSLFITTFNMGSAPLDNEALEKWLPRSGAYDLIVIGTQECSNKLKRESLREWREDRDRFQQNLRDIQSALFPHFENLTTTQTNLDPNANEMGAQPPDLYHSKNSKNNHSSSSNCVLDGDKNQRKQSGKGVSKNPFSNLVQMYLGNQYHKVASARLIDMRLMVLAHTRVVSHVSGVEKGRKATGLGGMWGNKGGLMVKIRVGGVSLSFLSCHLTPHEGEKKVKSRNHDVFEILKASSKSGNKKMRRLDIWLQCDHTFVLGDLNYRVDLAINNNSSCGNIKFDANEGATTTATTTTAATTTDPVHKLPDEAIMSKEVISCVAHKKFDILYSSDQLRREMEAGHVLYGFQELPPQFAPTFKVLPIPGEHYNDLRVPSYCDRILYTSFPGSSHLIQQTNYDSQPAVDISDHKPVFSTFMINTRDAMNRSVPVYFPWHRHLKFHIAHVTALNLPNVHTVLEPNPKLRLHGAVLLRDKIFSGAVLDPKAGTCTWGKIPEVALRISDRSALKHYWIVFSVWDREGRNRHRTLLGQASVSLEPWSEQRSDRLGGSLSTMDFEASIVRHGRVGGKLRGQMQIALAWDFLVPSFSFRR